MAEYKVKFDVFCQRQRSPSFGELCGPDQKLPGHKRLASNDMVLVIEAVESEIKSSLITLAIPSKPVKIAPVFR